MPGKMFLSQRDEEKRIQAEEKAKRLQEKEEEKRRKEEEKKKREEEKLREEKAKEEARLAEEQKKKDAENKATVKSRILAVILRIQIDLEKVQKFLLWEEASCYHYKNYSDLKVEQV